MNMNTVANSELLARFIVSSKWIRKQDNYVNSAAFIPNPDRELSVTRHSDILEEKLWNIGKQVAQIRKRNLYGRADVQAINVTNQNLKVEPDPIPSNPAHANIKNWPVEKEEQKILALEIAAAAQFVPNPL